MQNAQSTVTNNITTRAFFDLYRPFSGYCTHVRRVRVAYCIYNMLYSWMWPTRCNFYNNLLFLSMFCSTCFGRFFAHHQEVIKTVKAASGIVVLCRKARQYLMLCLEFYELLMMGWKTAQNMQSRALTEIKDVCKSCILLVTFKSIFTCKFRFYEPAASTIQTRRNAF